MILPLSQAPYDTRLVLEHVTDDSLAQRLGRLGISEGDVITRLTDEALACPVRVRTVGGEERVLAGGMAAKVIAHHDDGHKTPVAEMRPGEHGHVEGLLCGSNMERALSILGIRENDDIEMVRCVPPMDYIALSKGRRLFLHEGTATKIWGRSRGRDMQLATAGKGATFTIIALLGGMRTAAQMKELGLAPGDEILLDGVRPASCSGRQAMDRTVIASQSGLRLYLRRDREEAIMVSPA